MATASNSYRDQFADAGDLQARALAGCAEKLQSAVGAEQMKGEVEGLLVDTSVDGQQSTLVASADYSVWCHGPADGSAYIMIDSPWYSFRAPEATTVAVGPRVQDMSKGGHTFVLGRAGDQVTELTLDVAGVEVPAVLSDGWWTASWTTGSEDELGRAQVYYSTTDGATQSRVLNDLVVDE